MRATIILALLIILAIPACANTLEDFLSPYLYSGENYTADANVTQIDTSGGHYLLIQMRGQDAFFVSRTAEDNATAYSLVNDSSTIFTAIRTLGVSSTYPTQAELDNLTALISAFDASRHPREDDCTQSIGLDRPGATCDLDRCESCMSVPVCSDRIPYNGVDFTHAMYYYSINHAGLSASVVNATAACDERLVSL